MNEKWKPFFEHFSYFCIDWGKEVMHMMDKKQQRQVWQRVYTQNPPVSPIPKIHLQQCRQRLQQNLSVYEKHASHPLYGPAFQQLARQTQEHIQMLQQIMGQ